MLPPPCHNEISWKSSDMPLSYTQQALPIHKVSQEIHNDDDNYEILLSDAYKYIS